MIYTNKRDASLSSRILAIGRATPACRVSQEESFRISRYERDGVRRVFLNSGIDSRHFYFEQEPRLDETSDELNARYLRGAVETGCRAARTCLDVAGLSPRDVDLLVVGSTGYVCPDIGTRLIGHMGFRKDVRRASMIGLGCAGAVPSLQQAADFTNAHLGLVSLMLAVEICSACYYFDDTMETVVGNAICSDGAAAVVLTSSPLVRKPYPAIVDFESFLDPDHLQTVGLDHREGKLRIILGTDVRNLAAPLIQGALRVAREARAHVECRVARSGFDFTVGRGRVVQFVSLRSEATQRSCRRASSAPGSHPTRACR